MKNKGFTVYELLISFAFLAIVGYSMLSMILSLKDKAYLTELEFDMKSFKNALSIKIENDFTENTIEDITECGSYCINISYSNGITKEFSINKTDLYIKYGTEKYALPTDSYFGDNTTISIESTDAVTTSKNDSFLLVDIPIEHYDVEGDFGLHLMYQYDKDDYDFSDVVYFNPITYLNKIYNFSYTGNYQTFTAPVDGTYKIELWGAQGGTYNVSCYGGKGAYSAGNLTLSFGQKIYIYVGGAGSGNGTHTPQTGGWNGGGNAISDADSNTRQASGGGATDIRTIINSTYSNRLIVAGGGGGGAANAAIACTIGGYGGGLTGGNGTQYYESATIYGTGYGATQTAGGTYNAGTSVASSYKSNGSSGSGASTISVGGGGGYYGGGACLTSGGGGSGYIGGVSAGSMIAGNASMPAPSGGNENGHAGNGYARITVIDVD